ncbi:MULTISPECIES: hypothetical protein [Myxococcus]|uniref:hypothetical protein n=1 Tax=Myxococcus TaxID=32 RepID=UPI0013D21BF1|nr:MULTISPECIES: hypothetical protein [Myxococcus]NVJ21064.1 hypothetical protein [Myxococcus sp. AM011]
MTWQKKRLPKGFFRLETQPEEGAKVAEVVDAVIPGGKGFIQQLFRAKRDVLQAVSHLLQAQIHELEHIDSAIQAGAPLSPRMMTIKQLMDEASAKLRASKGAPPHEPPAHDHASAPGNPTHGVAGSARSTEAGPGSRPGPTGPERIKPT